MYRLTSDAIAITGSMNGNPIPLPGMYWLDRYTIAVDSPSNNVYMGHIVSSTIIAVNDKAVINGTTAPPIFTNNLLETLTRYLDEITSDNV